MSSLLAGRLYTAPKGETGLFRNLGRLSPRLDSLLDYLQISLVSGKWILVGHFGTVIP